MIEYVLWGYVQTLTNVNSPENNLEEIVSTLSLGWSIVWFPADDNKPLVVKLFDNCCINNYKPLEVMELNSNLLDLPNETARRIQNSSMYIFTILRGAPGLLETWPNISNVLLFGIVRV